MGHPNSSTGGAPRLLPTYAPQRPATLGAYGFGVILPVCVQVPVVLGWSFLPTRQLMAGNTSLTAALDNAASSFGNPIIGIPLLIAGLVGLPLGLAQVLCARSLGRSGASLGSIFLIGLLNPFSAILLVLGGLLGWATLR